MRIGIYTNRLPYPPIGGIPRFLHGLAQALNQLGIEVEFLIPNLASNEGEYTTQSNDQSSIEMNLMQTKLASSGPLSDLLLQDTIFSLSNWQNRGPYSEQQVHALRDMSIEAIANLVGSFDVLMISGSALLLFSKPDIVHLITRSSIPAIFVLLFPLAEIEFYFGPATRSLIANRISVCANACNFMVVPSKYVEREVHSVCKVERPIVRIPHGVGLREFQKEGRLSLERKRVISISRLSYFTEHKNIDCLLDAWPLVREQVPEATLTLVGAGSLPTLYDQELLEQEGVNVTGEVPDAEKIRLLHESRVFVLPSAIEGFGFSFVEALCAGVPVIGMRTTAIPEVVENGKNGFLLEPREIIRWVDDAHVIHQKPDISQLAEAIIRIMLEESTYIQLKRNCYGSVTMFDWPIVARRYLALCEELKAL